MNYRLVARILSRVALAEALLMLLSAGVALLYGDETLLSFGVPAALLICIFLALGRLKPRSRDFFAKEGLASVALSWILMSLFGALPFFLSGAIPSFVDSVFESVSGFTTTGATVLVDVEAMPHGFLFWRSFTHWIGGMGVLVFLLTITPLAGSHSMHLLRAESPGPSVEKLTPHLRSTADILYLIYLCMTLTLIALLLLGGMEPFDSVTNAFSVAGTGGFVVRNGGIMAYQSAYIENVITAFMFLFGVNFAVYYLLLSRKPGEALRSEELRWYFGLFVASALAVTLSILPESGGFLEALRLGAFQSASIMSTTGFATADFTLWHAFSQAALFLLMFTGASGGSTAGGFKLSRVVLVLKSIRREVSRLLHPRSVTSITFEGKVVEEETISGVLVYLGAYVCVLIAGFVLVSLDGFDFPTTFSSALAMLSNVGLGMSRTVPTRNFSIFSPFAKIVMSFLMLLGRLEIFPLLTLFMPGVWRRRR